MEREIVINSIGPEVRVALLEDGVIVELFVERSGEANIAGNVYKGRVQRVLPGMQAAFVDINLQQAAFIYVDDIINGRGFSQSEEGSSGIAGDPVVYEKAGRTQAASMPSLLLRSLFPRAAKSWFRLQGLPSEARARVFQPLFPFPGAFWY